MIKIDYPPPDFRTMLKDGTQMIFDELRKTWLRLTPEEWVRQNFVRFLLSASVPAVMIAMEKKILVGEMSKRFDILVFDQRHEPWMIIECKAMEVDLTADVLNQALRYGIAVPAPYLFITNGSYCAGFRKEEGRLVEIDEFPKWRMENRD